MKNVLKEIHQTVEDRIREYRKEGLQIKDYSSQNREEPPSYIPEWEVWVDMDDNYQDVFARGEPEAEQRVSFRYRVGQYRREGFTVITYDSSEGAVPPSTEGVKEGEVYVDEADKGPDVFFDHIVERLAEATPAERVASMTRELSDRILNLTGSPDERIREYRKARLLVKDYSSQGGEKPPKYVPEGEVWVDMDSQNPDLFAQGEPEPEPRVSFNYRVRQYQREGLRVETYNSSAGEEAPSIKEVKNGEVYVDEADEGPDVFSDKEIKKLAA